MLNRAVLVVRPKQPFLDWAAQLDDSSLVPNVEGEQTVYLIPQFDDDDEAQQVLERVFAEVFERELFGWHTDEDAWPEKRTLALFHKWFAVELVLSNNSNDVHDRLLAWVRFRHCSRFC